MTDTTQAINNRFRQLILSQSPSKRVAMACGMFATAKALIKAGIQKTEDIDQESKQIRRRIFLRLYGSDFDDTQKKKILKYLQAT